MSLPVGKRIGLVSIGGENLVPQIAVMEGVAETEVIAAPSSGRRIVVVAAAITATSTDTVSFKSGGATGTVVWSNVVPSRAFVMPLDGSPWIVARDGENLYVTTLGTATVRGVLIYVYALSQYVNGV